MVRVDIFKDNFKWYTTIAMHWDRYHVNEPLPDYESIHDTFRRCMSEQFKGCFSGMIAVCLEPFHEHSHQLMIRIEGEK